MLVSEFGLPICLRPSDSNKPYLDVVLGIVVTYLVGIKLPTISNTIALGTLSLVMIFLHTNLQTSLSAIDAAASTFTHLVK